jgi:hypothetical protein
MHPFVDCVFRAPFGIAARRHVVFFGGQNTLFRIPCPGSMHLVAPARALKAIGMGAPRDRAPGPFDFTGRWREFSEETMAGIDEWRLQHPRDKVVGGGAGHEIPLGSLMESAPAAEVTLLEPTLETIAIFTPRE